MPSQILCLMADLSGPFNNAYRTVHIIPRRILTSVHRIRARPGCILWFFIMRNRRVRISQREQSNYRQNKHNRKPDPNPHLISCIDIVINTRVRPSYNLVIRAHMEPL